MLIGKLVEASHICKSSLVFYLELKADSAYIPTYMYQNGTTDG